MSDYRVCRKITAEGFAEGIAEGKSEGFIEELEFVITYINNISLLN